MIHSRGVLDDLQLRRSASCFENCFDACHHPIIQQKFAALATLVNGQVFHDHDFFFAHLKRQIGDNRLQISSADMTFHCDHLRVSAISRVGIIAAKYARLVIALSFPLLRPIHSRGVLDDLQHRLNTLFRFRGQRLKQAVPKSVLVFVVVERHADQTVFFGFKCQGLAAKLGGDRVQKGFLPAIALA